jgi:cellulose synthase operon protein C
MNHRGLHAVCWYAIAAAALASSLLGCADENPDALVSSGKEFSARNEPRSAVIKYKAALQIRPEDASTRLLLGRALLASDDPAAARVELTKALAGGQPRHEVIPLLAQVLLEVGDNKRVIHEFETVELADPGAQATLKAHVAAAWAALGNMDKAQAALRQALAAVADHPATLQVQARFAARAGDAKAAIALAERSLVKEPASADGWALKGQLLGIDPNRTTEAQGALEKALSLEPAHLGAHTGLIGIELQRRQIDQARSRLEKMRAAAAQHPQTLLMDTQVALFAGELKRAREQAQTLIKAAPNQVMLLVVAGIAETQAGSLVLAESHFSKALQLNSNLPVARRGLAQIYMRLGQPSRALDVVQPLLDAAEPDAAVLTVAGQAQLRLGKPAAAQALFQRATTVEPGNQQAATALALSQLGSGDAGLALDRLSEMAAKSNETSADLALISARMERREFSQALAALDAAAKKSPKNAQLSDLRGRILMASGNEAGARAAFEEALAFDPKYFSATANLATVDLLQRKPEQARVRLEAALKDDPRNFYAGMALAELRGRTGASLDEQRQLLQQTIKANPGESGPRLMLIELNLRNKRLQDAVQAAQDATTALPNDPLVLDAAGRALSMSGDVQQAISTFKRLTNLDPTSVLPHTRLADLYRSTGERRQSEESLRRALEIDPLHSAVRGRLVDQMVQDKRSGEGLAFARDMQNRRADHPGGHLLEGLIQMRLKAPAPAAAAFRKALDRQPESDKIALMLHDALVASGRQAEADRAAADWARQHPRNGNVDYQLASRDIDAGRFGQAEPRLRSLVERFPQHALALNGLAWTLASQKKPGAVEFAERAVALQPKGAFYLGTLAHALAAENQNARALTTQKMAVDLAPSEAVLRFHLARIAIQAGEKDLARKELEALAAKGKQLGFHGEVAQLLKTL